MFVEIPLFHVLNACITFCNINGTENSADGVHLHPQTISAESREADQAQSWTVGPSEGAVRNRRGASPGSKKELGMIEAEASDVAICSECVVDMDVFEIPAGLAEDDSLAQPLLDENDELLQFAIQQSLLESEQTYGLQDTERVALSEEDELQRSDSAML